METEKNVSSYVHTPRTLNKKPLNFLIAAHQQYIKRRLKNKTSGASGNSHIQESPTGGLERQGSH